MKKHKYKIIINSEPKVSGSVYKYGNTDGIEIRVSNQKASISYEMSVIKSFEDFTSLKDRVFKDAYKKIFLIHAVKCNTGLQVNKIIIQIDDSEKIITKENDLTGHFPFVFSLIKNENLGLGSEWSELEGKILELTKTKLIDDQRFSAVYAFLNAKTREYRIDRFSNLWMSMNAYYNYVAKKYEDRIKQEYQVNNLTSNLKLSMRDAESIGLVAWLMDQRYTDMTKKDELEKLWKNNYVIEKELEDLSESDSEKLFVASSKELEGEIIPESYSKISNRAKEFNVKTFPFILLIYAYNLRCKYFHGNTPTLLVSAYNDYEICVLSTVNYFLERFLSDNIPKIFEDDFWNESKQEMAINYVKYIRKWNDEKFQKEIKKAKI